MEVNTDLDKEVRTAGVSGWRNWLQVGTEEACVVGKGRPASSEE